MKLSSKKLCRKIQYEWSACTLLSLLLICSLICVYSFESIGLINSSRTIDYRLLNPESHIKLKNKNTILSTKIDFLSKQNELIQNMNKFDINYIKSNKVNDIFNYRNLNYNFSTYNYDKTNSLLKTKIYDKKYCDLSGSIENNNNFKKNYFLNEILIDAASYQTNYESKHRDSRVEIVEGELFFFYA